MTVSKRFYHLLIALSFSGVVAHSSILASSPLASAVTDSGAFAPVVVEGECDRFKEDIAGRAVPLLTAGDFAALDAMAREFRAKQTAFANGSWRLSYFYRELSDVGQKATEKEWETRLTLLRHWFEADTKSITPRVVMASALVQYAWHARGGGWSSEVKPDSWPLVAERVAEASRILEAARDLPEKCPVWYAVWMTKALLSGDNKERYDEIFGEAVRDFPAYKSFYLLKVLYLQERWYGAHGEWEAFAKESADRLGGEEGDILYAQILWYVHEMRSYGNPIAETAMEWPRARHGFEAIRRRYPESLSALSEFCSLSGHAPGEGSLMRHLFDEIGNRVVLSVWKNQDRFLKDRNWAYSQ